MFNAMYEKFGAKVIADSAFPQGGYGSIARASKANEAGPQNAQELGFEQQLTSARQPAEWGMRAMQGGFPRLKARFPYEERGHRRIVMRMISALHNARTRMVGINQIRNVYMPELEKEAEGIFNIDYRP